MSESKSESKPDPKSESNSDSKSEQRAVDLPVAQVKGQRPAPSAGRRAKHRRHLGNYLLDKQLQLRYVAFVSILSAIISGSLGYLIYKQESRATAAVVEDAVMNEQAADSDRARDEWKEVTEFIRDELEADDDSLILTMAGVGVGLVVVLSLFLLVLTHKVAGPLHKVALYFDKMRDGRLGDTWPLRRWDMLKDFYADFKSMHDAVRERAVADNAAVARLLAACEAAGVSRSGELGHRLDELETYKKARDEALA